MKNEALEFATYLETQLVPDFQEAGMTPTADDFATAARLLRGLAEDPAVAALVTAARAVAQRWEDRSLPLGEDLSALAAALAPFTGNVAPEIPDEPESPETWGIRTRGTGSLKAVFNTLDEAQTALSKIQSQREHYVISPVSPHEIDPLPEGVHDGRKPLIEIPGDAEPPVSPDLEIAKLRQLVSDLSANLDTGDYPENGDLDLVERVEEALGTKLLRADVSDPVSPDTPDRRQVWSFEVDGKHVRWCGTLDQWHKDRVAYVDKSEGTWEAHGPHMWRFIEPAIPGVSTKRHITIFRAVKNK